MAAWDHSLHHNGSASRLRLTHDGFTCRAPYTLTPGRPSPGLSYPPASPHHSPTTPSGPTPPPPSTRKPKTTTGMVSIKGLQRWRVSAGTGISTRCPSTTPIGLALGPDLPWADQPAPGTLGHPAGEFPTPHSLLMPAFSLACPPPHAHTAASPNTRRSPTHPNTTLGCHGFGGMLEPRYIIGAESLDQ